MTESKFPIVFEKCPICGCLDTITQVAWDEEAEKGRVNKDTPVSAQHLQIPLMDPKKPPLLSVGILIQNVDYCAECGAGYCKGANVITGQVGMAPPKGQGRPPGGMGPFSSS